MSEQRAAAPAEVLEGGRTMAGRAFWWPLATILIAALAALLGAQAVGFPLEVDHYKFWTKLITENGLQAAYSGTFPHTYAIYPPLTLYFYWIAGHIYQAGMDPTFEIGRALADPTLTAMIKVPAMAFHLLTAAGIYWATFRRFGRRTAVISSAGYALQPGVLFDIAVWGQPDSVHSFFVLLTVLCLTSRRMAWAGASFALAAMTKPQAWIMAPLFVFFVWRRHGLGHLARSGVAGAAVALVVVSPFFWYGTWRQLLRLPGQIATVAPFVSANAHNLWWLVVQEHASVIPDFERFHFGLTYSEVGLLLVATTVLFSLSRLSDAPLSRTLPAIAAFQAFAFFMVTTKAHENHAFLALPLLSLVWVRSPSLRWVYLALSVTFLANIVLHDPSLEPRFQEVLQGQLRLAQRLNSLANAGILAGWVAVLLFARPPGRGLWLSFRGAAEGSRPSSAEIPGPSRGSE